MRGKREERDRKETGKRQERERDRKERERGAGKRVSNGKESDDQKRKVRLEAEQKVSPKY